LSEERERGFSGDQPTMDMHQHNLNPEEGLIRPMKRRMDPEIGPDAVLVVTPKDLDLLIKSTGSRRTAWFDMGFFQLHLIEKRGGGSFSIIGPFLGAPHAVMGMEKVIALGAQRIWAFGWCGSIQPDLRIGDYVIPMDSISEEGTSAHYPIGGRPPCSDPAVCRSMDALLSKRCGLSCRRGTVWTTDAPYRETPSKVRGFQQKGVLAVEMEMSALMTVAIYRTVAFGALLVVSDELFDLRWRPGFREPIFKEACRTAGELMLEMADSQDQ
jgi:purine-nucleoside phosphorylase